MAYRFEPWHALAIGGGVLGLGLLIKGGGAKRSFKGAAEGFSSLEDETSCAQLRARGTESFRDFVLRNFGGADLGIFRACADAPSGHYSGRSWDWGTLSGNADVDGLFRYLFANNAEVIRRAGITYLIYNRQIWNARSQTWSAYNGANPHTDHVHFSLSTPGALGQTSFYQQPIA